MLRIILSALFFVFFYLSPVPASANFLLSVIKVPPLAGRSFTAQLVGASDFDPTPNPCYHKNDCRLRFFTIAEEWLPLGLEGYFSNDYEGFPKTTDAQTLGDVAQALRKQGQLFRTGSDFISSSRKNPCVVIAASLDYSSKMIAGTIISNCAKGIVQAPTCKIEPTQIEINFDELQAGKVNGAERSRPVTLTCSSGGRVSVETNSKEIIPLNGSSDTKAELDWGQGYGNPARVSLADGEIKTLPLRTRGSGFTDKDAGVYQGSTVVNISYY